MRVTIVGAGIVGVSTALWLMRDGHAVTLVDREGPGTGASFGNGGVLASAAMVPVTVPGILRRAPAMLFDPDQPLFLRWSYLPRLLPWLARYLRHATPSECARIAGALHSLVGDSLEEHRALAAGTPAARWIVPSDYVFLYRSRAAFEADGFGWGLRRAAGWDWEEMERDALAAYDPCFGADIRFAVRLGDHGRIADPGAYVVDLAQHLEARGGRILRAQVTDVVRDGDRVTGVRAGGETIPADAVVLAAGAQSRPLARALGVDVPLETERGYHLELWGTSVMPRAPVMFAAQKFVATPMEGRLRLAGILEFGGLRAPASRAPLDLLLRQARAALPGLAWTETREWLGHRPATTDSLPVLGPAPRLKGAYLAFGHHHVGLTSGPRSGRLLAQAIAGRAPNIDLSPFSPARFAARRAPA